MPTKILCLLAASPIMSGRTDNLVLPSSGETLRNIPAKGTTEYYNLCPISEARCNALSVYFDNPQNRQMDLLFADFEKKLMACINRMTECSTFPQNPGHSLSGIFIKFIRGSSIYEYPNFLIKGNISVSIVSFSG